MKKLSNRWDIIYSPEAFRDLAVLSGGIQSRVINAIERVSRNPLPQREGGYGVELGKKNGIDLSGLLKIKLKKSGVRIVYKLKRDENGMKIVVIGMRADNEVYKEAEKRERRS